MSDVISTFAESLAAFIEAMRNRPDGDAAAVRALASDEGYEPSEELEAARAYTLADTAVRDWVTEAFRHVGLEDRYTSRVPEVRDGESAYAAFNAAGNAQGVAGAPELWSARYCALTASLAAKAASQDEWLDTARLAGDCLFWWGYVDSNVDYATIVSQVIADLQE